MAEKAAEIAVMAAVPRCGVIVADEHICLTCRECEVACSLYHEGECNPELSRIRIDFNDFAPGFPNIRVCKQCDYPACYYACVEVWKGKGSAMRIDPETGARFVDESICRGCGACAMACPLTIKERVLFYKADGKKRKYFKCDLCKDRPEGPVCVEVCPAGALKFVPAKERVRVEKR